MIASQDKSLRDSFERRLLLSLALQSGVDRRIFSWLREATLLYLCHKNAEVV